MSAEPRRRTNATRRRRPSVEAALAPSRHAVFWLEDAPGTTYDALAGATTADLAIVGGGYCGLWTAVLAKRRNPGARVVLLEANTDRVGGVRAQRRLLRGEPDPRRGERPVPLARRVRRARAARRRTTWTPSRPTCATSAWTASSSAPASWPSRSRSTRSSGCASRPASWTATPSAPRSTARSSWPASGAATTARWCTRPGWPASWPGSPPTSASRSTRAPGSPASTPRPAGRSSYAPPAGSVTADRVALATNVFPSLLRRTRMLTVPVYDYVLMTEPLTDAQLGVDRLGAPAGARRPGQPVPLLAADRRQPDPVGRVRRGLPRRAAGCAASYEERPATFTRAGLALPRGVPAAGGR